MFSALINLHNNGAMAGGTLVIDCFDNSKEVRSDNAPLDLQIGVAAPKIHGHVSTDDPMQVASTPRFSATRITPSKIYFTK